MSALSIENSVSPVNTAAINQSAGLDSGNNLNQADFIELLVAQVKNQDPTKPMEPSQFMNQLAQFSTVSGVQDLNTSFGSLADKLSSDQSLRAASLVGRSVLVDGGEGLLGAASNLEGQIDLESSAADISLNIFDSRGVLVRTLPLGSMAAGSNQFQWDGLDDSGVRMPAGIYRVEVDALIDGDRQALPVAIETRIDSISVNSELAGTPQATVLNLATGSQVSLADVQQIR